MLVTYQSYIGADKLFPKTVSFEMNIEDKTVIIQILDCWMRLTSILWQVRMSNKYKSFTDYTERRGCQNVGHMIHANRFGEYEESCADEIYLADVWMAWLDTFSNMRNQSACFRSNESNLMRMFKFL